MRCGAGAMASQSSAVRPAAETPANHGSARRTGGWPRNAPVRESIPPPAGSVSGAKTERLGVGESVFAGSAIYQTPIRMMS